MHEFYSIAIPITTEIAHEVYWLCKNGDTAKRDMVERCASENHMNGSRYIWINNDDSNRCLSVLARNLEKPLVEETSLM